MACDGILSPFYSNRGKGAKMRQINLKSLTSTSSTVFDEFSSVFNLSEPPHRLLPPAGVNWTNYTLCGVSHFISGLLKELNLTAFYQSSYLIPSKRN